MSGLRPRDGAHPGDGPLVAWLDDALDPGDRQRVGGHLDGCEACRARLAELEARAEAVSAWIEAHDPAPPPAAALEPVVSRPVRRSRRWAVAAGIVLVAAAVAGPARGWVLEALGLAPGGTAVPGDAAPAELRPPDPTAASSFVPVGPVMELTFRAVPVGSRLVLQASDDSLAHLVTPGPTVELTVGPDRFEVVDPGARPGEFVLRVPGGVDRVRVRTRRGLDTLLAMPESTGRGPLYLSLDLPPAARSP